VRVLAADAGFGERVGHGLQFGPRGELLRRRHRQPDGELPILGGGGGVEALRPAVAQQREPTGPVATAKSRPSARVASTRARAANGLGTPPPAAAKMHGRPPQPRR
jgi:hypothetical protein